jgi:nitrate reductase NapE component
MTGVPGPRARRWTAPAIVTAVAIVGAHPFCNWMFRCGCGVVSLTAHCNIHAPAPPHCPWCAQPMWFALAALLALLAAGLGIVVAQRRHPSLWPALGAGLVGLVAGGYAGAALTLLAKSR